MKGGLRRAGNAHVAPCPLGARGPLGSGDLLLLRAVAPAAAARHGRHPLHRQARAPRGLRPPRRAPLRRAAPHGACRRQEARREGRGPRRGYRRGLRRDRRGPPGLCALSPGGRRGPWRRRGGGAPRRRPPPPLDSPAGRPARGCWQGLKNRGALHKRGVRTCALEGVSGEVAPHLRHPLEPRGARGRP